MRKNKLWLLLVTLVLVLPLLAICAPKATPVAPTLVEATPTPKPVEATPTPIPPTATTMPQEVKLSAEDRGRTIELGIIGQRLSISLSGNPSTGYIWEPREEMMLRAEGILRQVGVEFKPESDLLGAPGEMILSFEAVGLGTIGLELVYWRPWKKELLAS